MTAPSEMRRSPALRERGPDRARRRDRVARQPERARKTLVPPPGRKPERHGAVGAVQRLVVRAVAGEDEDRVDVAPRRRPRAPVAWPGPCVNFVRSSTRSRRDALDRRDPLAR